MDSEPNKSIEMSSARLKVNHLLPTIPHDWVDKAEYIEEQLTEV